MLHAANEQGKVENYYNLSEITAMSRCIKKVNERHGKHYEISDFVMGWHGKLEIEKGSSGNCYAVLQDFFYSNKLKNIFVEIDYKNPDCYKGIYEYEDCSMHYLCSFLKNEFNWIPTKEQVGEAKELQKQHEIEWHKQHPEVKPVEGLQITPDDNIETINNEEERDI